jgi:hypothetical protein
MRKGRERGEGMGRDRDRDTVYWTPFRLTHKPHHVLADRCALWLLKKTAAPLCSQQNRESDWQVFAESCRIAPDHDHRPCAACLRGKSSLTFQQVLLVLVF